MPALAKTNLCHGHPLPPLPAGLGDAVRLGARGPVPKKTCCEPERGRATAEGKTEPTGTAGRAAELRHGLPAPAPSPHSTAHPKPFAFGLNRWMPEQCGCLHCAPAPGKSRGFAQNYQSRAAALAGVGRAAEPRSTPQSCCLGKEVLKTPPHPQSSEG